MIDIKKMKDAKITITGEWLHMEAIKVTKKEERKFEKTRKAIWDTETKREKLWREMIYKYALEKGITYEYNYETKEIIQREDKGIDTNKKNKEILEKIEEIMNKGEQR